MKRRKSLQPSDFPPPKPVSQEKFSEICESQGISDRHAAEFKSFLDHLVVYVRESMSPQKAPNRKGDRARISNMFEWIKDIRERLQDMRIDGRLAVRSTATCAIADELYGAQTVVFLDGFRVVAKIGL